MKPTTRTLTVETDSPVRVEVTLLGHAGIITIRSEADCKLATLTISTPDEEGPAADAVRQAALTTHDGMTAHIEGQVSTGSDTKEDHGTTLAEAFITAGESATGTHIAYVRNSDPNADSAIIINDTSPITITAVVPESSSVVARIQNADIQANGIFNTVRVERAITSGYNNTKAMPGVTTAIQTAADASPNG